MAGCILNATRESKMEIPDKMLWRWTIISGAFGEKATPLSSAGGEASVARCWFAFSRSGGHHAG